MVRQAIFFATGRRPPRDTQSVTLHGPVPGLLTEHTELLTKRDQLSLELVRDEEATRTVDSFGVSLDLDASTIAEVQRLAATVRGHEPVTESDGLIDAIAVAVVSEVLHPTVDLRTEGRTSSLRKSRDGLASGDADGHGLRLVLVVLFLLVLLLVVMSSLLVFVVLCLLLFLVHLRHQDDFEFFSLERRAVFLGHGNLFEIEGLRLDEAFFADLIGDVLEVRLDLVESNDSHWSVSVGSCLSDCGLSF